MRNRSYLFPVFCFSLALSFFFLFLSNTGIVGFFQSSMQSLFFPFSLFVTQRQASPQKDSQLDLLQKENASLRGELSQMQSLKEDNKALRDQFATSNPAPQKLLPAAIVGMNFIPNLTFPEIIIIHVGTVDGVRAGEVVVSQNIVVGQIIKVSKNYSQVQLVTSGKTTIPIKVVETGAIGVMKGQGSGGMVVDNILLSDTIQAGNTIVTLGNQDVSGSGYVPGLVVGKVLSVEKNPSSLFQKAKVEQLFHAERLTKVFVFLN